jgi:hypothetical protein
VFTTENEPNPRRLKFQTLLEELSGYGEANVHFQPPSKTELNYPCIVYGMAAPDVKHADNQPWRHTPGYQVTVISRKPEESVLAKFAALPLCKFSTAFKTDNLNHTVYNIFF